MRYVSRTIHYKRLCLAISCVVGLSLPAAASPGDRFAWGGGGTGGGGSGGGGGQGGPQRPDQDPCASLGGTAVAALTTVEFDVLPPPYRVADCLDKKKKKLLKGGARYDQGPPVQQYPPPGTSYPPPQYVDPGGNIVPPPPPPPTQTYDGGVSGGGAPPPPQRPYPMWGTVKLGQQWVKWKMPINSSQQGVWNYPNLPLYNGKTLVGYGNVTVTVNGRSVTVQMSSPIPYSWGPYTIPQGY